MSKTFLRLVAATILSTTVCWADFEWPSGQVLVRIDGKLVRAYWKDGKPFVEREAVLPLLHIRTGPDELDLAETLSSKGYTMVTQPDGSIDCNLAASATGSLPASGPLVVRPATQSPKGLTLSKRPSKGPTARQHQQEWRNQQSQDSKAPRLVASGYRYVADTEFIRAYCLIQNQGGGPSPGCTAVGEFVDWFGEPFARDSRSIPRLGPGESVELTFFSLVQKDEAPRKADKYTCRVKFLGSGLAEDGTAAKRNPTNSYRPSAAVKARVKSSDFHVESSTTKFTPGTVDT